MKRLVSECEKIFEGKFNTVVDVIKNPFKQVVLICPFEGDKKLHNRISIFVVKYMYGENIPENKLKVMMYTGRKELDVTYVSNLDELTEILNDYIEVIEDAVA